MNIYVVGCRHRKALVTPYLTGLPYVAYCTPDYELPEGWQPTKAYRRLVWNQRNHMRCNYGHRDVMRMMSPGEVALIMEDDALPLVKDWHSIAQCAAQLLDQYKIVSLHTRGMEREVWEVVPWIDGLEVWVRDGGWAVGSLAYLITYDTAQGFVNQPYEGLPMDLSLLQLAHSRFAAIMPSPFAHGTGDDATLMKPDGRFTE